MCFYFYETSQKKWIKISRDHFFVEEDIEYLKQKKRKLILDRKKTHKIK
jgi:hypothetical protein